MRSLPWPVLKHRAETVPVSEPWVCSGPCLVIQHSIQAAGSTAIQVTDRSTFCLIESLISGQFCYASNHKEENVGGTECKCLYNVHSFTTSQKENKQWFLVVQFYSK